MTVSEAFAKAGYPIPDQAKVYYSTIENRWAHVDVVGLAHSESPCDWFFEFSDKERQKRHCEGWGAPIPDDWGDYVWIYETTTPEDHEYDAPNLANLPADDVKDLLPECVQRVLS